MTSSTLLLRQIHPSFVQNGRPTSQAFRPTPKDEDKLSVYDGDKIAPEPAWNHYTVTLGHKSVGIIGLAVSDCESLNLSVAPDPESFPEHCTVDFTGLNRNEIEKKAKQLSAFAIKRGWLFTAPTNA